MLKVICNFRRCGSSMKIYSAPRPKVPRFLTNHRSIAILAELQPASEATVIPLYLFINKFVNILGMPCESVHTIGSALSACWLAGIYASPACATNYITNEPSPTRIGEWSAAESCDFDDLLMNWLSAKHTKIAAMAIRPSHRILLDAISLTKHDLLNRKTPKRPQYQLRWLRVYLNLTLIVKCCNGTWQQRK